VKGTIAVPGDKSISHRALIFASLIKGQVEIENCSPAVDCRSSAECLEALGLNISSVDSESKTKGVPKLLAKSPGLFELTSPQDVLNAGNSGTTIRLLSGLLAGQPFSCVLDGDQSLRQRPMARISAPLEKMGAQIQNLGDMDAAIQTASATTAITKLHAPFRIQGARLKGQVFDLSIASAQVQTALLLAGLQAEGTTTVNLPAPVRDHTARMFRLLGVPFQSTNPENISVSKLAAPLTGKHHIHVPADISSAAFVIVAAALIPNSDILLTGVGINEGRLLVTDVLTRMGAQITFENKREFGYEPVADIRVKYNGRLKSATISGEEIATGIDEIPILALAGAFCDGVLTVSGAEELRFKESDRLAAIIDNLSAAGALIEGKQDGFVLTGQEKLPGGSTWKTFDDHRLAMSGLVAQLVVEEKLAIEEIESIKISYPSFAQDLESVLS
jgi:3-phosphoshikimate 1-carboxyvinyltransferase